LADAATVIREAAGAKETSGTGHAVMRMTQRKRKGKGPWQRAFAPLSGDRQCDRKRAAWFDAIVQSSILLRLRDRDDIPPHDACVRL
jgi:hypothetical protein